MSFDGKSLKSFSAKCKLSFILTVNNRPLFLYLPLNPKTKNGFVVVKDAFMMIFLEELKPSLLLLLSLMMMMLLSLLAPCGC